MNYLNPLTREKASGIIRKRKGETRVGERAEYFSEKFTLEKNLARSNAKFVLLGLPEDIGVRANFGRAGAHTAWRPALESILSLQSNSFFDGTSLFVLGEVDFSDLVKNAEHLSAQKPDELLRLRKLTAEIDARVAPVISAICSAGKIPIVIGGGHNNSFGNLKGAASGLKKVSAKKPGGINCINCDAHADMRPLEGRHSGNGFSYAFGEKFLQKYSVLGIHENFNTSAVLDKFEKNRSRLHYVTYEDIFIREKISFRAALKKSIDFVKQGFCGVEIDLDAITNVPSSAKTSSGISPVQARQFAYYCGRFLKPAYLHIAEGAPILAHIKADNKTGKLIAYLVTDFIKGCMRR